MIDQIISTVGDFMSSLSPTIIYRYRLLMVLLCAFNALLLLFLLFRTPASIRRRDRFFLSALADIVADRFAEDAGKAFSNALNSRFPVDDDTDPRNKISGRWHVPIIGMTLDIRKERGFWRADIEGHYCGHSYADNTVMRYLDNETFDKNLYTAQGKRYWTVAYDELLDTLFIPELDMTFIRQPDTPVPDMRVQIMDVVSDEPQGHEQLHEPGAAFEELSETPGRENGNEPEK